MKKCKKPAPLSRNLGGEIIKIVPSILGAMNPAAGAVAGLASNFIQQQINPLTVTVPQTQTNYRGFNQGGMIDMPLNSGAMMVEGNPGIDTNFRNVEGTPVNLTAQEIVTNNNASKSPYVFSDDESMIDPSTGMTYAQMAKTIEMSNGKAEQKLKKHPNYQEARNTIKVNEMITNKKMKAQETQRAQSETEATVGMQPGGMSFKKGGYIKGYAAGGYLPMYGGLPAMNQAIKNKMNLAEVTPYNISITPGDENLSYLELGDFYRAPRNIINPDGDLSQADRGPQLMGNVPTTTTTSTPTAKPSQNVDTSSFGDYAYVALKGAELIGKGILANQPVRTYNASDYTVGKPIYNPNAEIQRNNQSFRSNTYGINTGNANLDRALMTTMYSANLANNNQIAEKYRQMQNESDLRVDQYNANARMQVNTINEQNSAAKYNAQDALLTSVGTFGQVVQDMSNTRTTNRINLSILQGMSDKYKININELRNLMRNNPSQFNNMLVQFQNS